MIHLTACLVKRKVHYTDLLYGLFFFLIFKAAEIFACERKFHTLFLSVFDYCCGTEFLKLSRTDILGKISLFWGLSCVLCDS